MRRGIARDIEPLPAPETMYPPLAMNAARIVPHEQIAAPGVVGYAVSWLRALDMRLTAAFKFDFIARTAPWAIDEQHRRESVSDARGGRLIDERARAKACEREGLCNGVRSAGR